MSKKGQAAMEFLMTYGWAILAAIIAIGVLAYFGVFSPGKLVGNQGIVNAPFNMDAFKISALNDEISMEVTQNLGESITLLGVEAGFNSTLVSPAAGLCSITSSTPGVTADADANGVADAQWTSGTKVTFVVDCTVGAGWAVGDQIKSDIKVTYRKAGSSLDQQSTGSVRGTSQA